jgi:hypothetical protein
MITLFTCPKPFRGHIGVIQRNAIISWTLLKPQPQILLFGAEEGTAEIAEELKLLHVPDVAQNEYGTPLLSSIFQQAQTLSTHALLGYLNSDIMLLPDFLSAVNRVARLKKRFLMVGQRCNIDIGELVSFDDNWTTRLTDLARSSGTMFGPLGIDYFIFPRQQSLSLPPFAIGRAGWDNWMIYHARSKHIPVIDATPVVLAIHQNHDYSHHPDGHSGAYQGNEAQRNIEIAGGREHIFTLDDATYILNAEGLKHSRRQMDTRSSLKRFGVLYPRFSWLSRLVIRIYDALKRRRLI